MPDLPVMLKVSGKRCVIVGGGAVALRRAKGLLEAGAGVQVIAPRVDDELAQLPITVIPRPYQPGDLAGALLVVAATDDPTVNAQVVEDAHRVGVLVNRTDDPESGDLTVPAHAHHGPITLSVHTSGISAAAAATIRRQLSDQLDPDWPRLLDVVAPFRAAIQQNHADASQRQARLKALTSDEAMQILKKQGLAAVQAYCRRLVEEANP